MPKKPTHRQEKGQQRGTLGKKLGIGLWTSALAVATLLGYVILIPRLTVNVSDPVDLDDPFSSSVTVENTGYIPLYSVTPEIAVRNIEVFMSPGGATRRFEGADSFSSRLSHWPPRDLSIDEKFTFAFNDLLTSSKPMKSADVGIVIKYTIPIIHLHREKLFSYFARQQSNGKFYWYANVPPTN